MRSIGFVGVFVPFFVVGCAHVPKPERTVAIPAVVPPSKPQLVATPVAAQAIDPTAELDAALRGATIFFELDGDRLNPQGTEALQRVAQVLKRYPKLALKIEGNCDERGTEEYNLALGQRRAEAARQYLMTLGVGPQQLNTVSYGALRPADPSHSEEAWSQNRRDELHPSH